MSGQVYLPSAPTSQVINESGINMRRSRDENIQLITQAIIDAQRRAAGISGTMPGTSPVSTMMVRPDLRPMSQAAPLNGRRMLGTPSGRSDATVVAWPKPELDPQSGGRFDPDSAMSRSVLQANGGAVPLSKTSQWSERHINPNPAQDRTITFINDNPNNPTTDQEVNPHLAMMLEEALADPASPIQSININSSTGGHKGWVSRHNDDSALDINKINGLSVSDPRNAANVKWLQDRMLNDSRTSEIFGPLYLKDKDKRGGRFAPVLPDSKKHIDLINDHKTHVHIATGWDEDFKSGKRLDGSYGTRKKIGVATMMPQTLPNYSPANILPVGQLPKSRLPRR